MNVVDDLAIDVMQTVIRTERLDATIYEFDPKILSEFIEFAPLQYSFLLVHEWLWDLTQDVQIIRDINRFLHSEAAQKMSENQFRLSVLRLGLDFRVKEFLNDCHRTLEIREQIVEATGMACEDIRQSDLYNNPVTKQRGPTEIKITGTPLSDFKLGDFSGLTWLSRLTLTHLQLRHIYEFQFETAREIDFLNLSHNSIRSLEFNTDPASKKRTIFNVIDLSHNLITDVPEQVCELIGTGQYTTFIVSHNPLTESAKLKIKSLPCAQSILF